MFAGEARSDLPLLPALYGAQLSPQKLASRSSPGRRLTLDLSSIPLPPSVVALC